jgi:hypothetical protein
MQTCNSQPKVIFYLLHKLHGVPQYCILFQQTLCRHTNFSLTDVVGSTSFGHETAVVRDIRTSYTKTMNQSATNYLTPRRWALLKRQPVVQPLNIFPALYGALKVSYSVHNSSTLVPILSHTNSVHTPSSLSKIELNLTHPPTSLSSYWSISFWLSQSVNEINLGKTIICSIRVRN